MKWIIIATWWANDNKGTIGIVAARTGMHDPEKGEWMAYMGTANGYDRVTDEQCIADLGEKLQPQLAAAFFPHLDISKYKGE